MASGTVVCNNRTEVQGVLYLPARPYCLHTKDTLEAFKIVRHTMTCISILLAALCAFIVIASRSLTRAYGYMLIGLLFVWTSLDVTMQWVIDPVFLFPELLLYRRSPLLNFPITAGTSLSILLALLMLAMVMYMAMFLYRHQVLVAVGSRFKIPEKARVVFLLLLLIPYLACGVEFYVVCFPALPLYQRWLSAEFFDAHMIAARVDFYNVDRVWYMTLICDGHFAWMFVVAVDRPTYFHSSKKRRSLIVQAFTPVVFIILPMTIVLLTHVFVINQFSAIINELKVMPFDVLLVVTSFHATAHSIALIYTTPAFKAKLIQMLSIVFPWLKPKDAHIPLAASASITATSLTP
ncbi:hypothetical protein PRIPAC_77130 [Pristionchus pacificus]|uniref:G protein-coupled receptor n=1 Tax=Pristionchus pacificus TaxID=54126 RepID=A0A2A6CL20_PRIPA|nr:hypothetical protein PRIPAC_77130 [Pristionchus pacificus]|eukprot:PDM78788.1 G protein-coupled receptor [Pristionchus pacificus]